MRYFLFLIPLFVLASGFAKTVSAEELNRFSAHETNYAVFQYYDQGSPDPEQSALEVRVSLKLFLGGCYNQHGVERNDYHPCQLFTNALFKNFQVTSYFTYTNEFDFYVTGLNVGGDDTRVSSPVIGRTENPGLMVSFVNQDKYAIVNALHVSLEHESNGQSLSEERWSEFDTIQRQIYIDGYLGNDGEQSFWQDTASRSFSHYLELRTDNRLWLGTRRHDLCDDTLYCMQTSLAGRLYGGSIEDTVFTEDGVSNRFDAKDFHRYELLLSNKLSLKSAGPIKAVEFFAELQTGSLNLDRYLSADYGMGIDLALGGSYVLPLYFRAHSGPFERFSEYNERITSYSVGVQLRRPW